MNSCLGWMDYSAMGLYLLALVVIGWYCSREKTDSKGYLLGGGKMPAVALGISCLMAALSAFSLVMVPGEIFAHGLNYWALGLLAPLFTLVTCRIFMRFYFKLGSFTPFEYLEYRYSPGVRALIAGMTIYLRIIYLGMVLFSTSKIFEGAAGWPAWAAILAVGLISMVFTTAGGLKAVVWTDVMQFIVLTGGLFAILGFLFYKIDGGIVSAMVVPFQNGRGLDLFADSEFYQLKPYVRLSFWLLLLSQFMSPISTMASDQMTVQRLLASGSYQNAVKTQTVNTFLTIPTILILYLIGMATFTFFHQHPEISTPSADTALFTFIATELPSPVPGLVIAGMMAAVISTLNAVFNSMAAIYVKEFHLRFLRPGCPESEQVRVSRIATLCVAVISVAFGLIITYSAEWLRQSVAEAQTIFTAFDAIVIPAFLFAVLSKRASTLLVWATAGLIWGIKLMTIAWYMVSTSVTGSWQPGEPLGWGGPIGWTCPLLLTLAGVILVLLWLAFARNWPVKRSMFGLFLGMLVSGAGLGMCVWAAASAIWITDKPLALSFQYVALPAIAGYILLGTVWLLCGKVQPREKYQGLTLFDHDEVIRKEK